MLSFTHVLKEKNSFHIVWLFFQYMCERHYVVVLELYFCICFQHILYDKKTVILDWDFIHLICKVVAFPIRKIAFLCGRIGYDRSRLFRILDTDFLFLFDIICKTCEDDYVLHDTSVFLPFFRFIFRPFLDNKMFRLLAILCFRP